MAQDRPESILPPGFGDPAARPAARPSATPTATAPRAPAARPGPAPTSPVPGGAVLPGDPAGAVVQPLPSATPAPIPSATPSPVDPRLLARYEMPAYARRSLATVGLSQDMPADAFGAADGGFIETLMRHTPAPLPSLGRALPISSSARQLPAVSSPSTTLMASTTPSPSSFFPLLSYPRLRR